MNNLIILQLNVCISFNLYRSCIASIFVTHISYISIGLYIQFVERSYVLRVKTMIFGARVVQYEIRQGVLIIRYITLKC